MVTTARSESLNDSRLYTRLDCYSTPWNRTLEGLGDSSLNARRKLSGWAMIEGWKKGAEKEEKTSCKKLSSLSTTTSICLAIKRFYGHRVGCVSLRIIFNNHESTYAFNLQWTRFNSSCTVSIFSFFFFMQRLS